MTVKSSKRFSTRPDHRWPSPLDSAKVRQQIKDEGALPVIPNRSTAIRKAYCPKRFYRRRHKIENFFCRIKDWCRRIATRNDKLARNSLAATTLVCQ